MINKQIVSIILFLTLISASFGQDIRVNASFDTNRIYIGDQTRFTVTIDQPDGVKLSVHQFKDTIIKNIEIIAGPLTDTLISQKEFIRIRQEYLVTSFDSGLYQVPPIYAEVRLSDGLKRYYSDYSYIEVVRSLIAPSDSTAKIFDIIAPYRAPVTLGEILPWIFLLILAAAIIFFAIRFFKKFRKNDSGQEMVVLTDPPHIIAFRELEKLKEEKLWQKGEVKEYYSRLTEILRQYLENRYGVFSLELTTHETLDALLKTGFKKDTCYNRLKSVLNSADMVKFAKYTPEPTDNEFFFQEGWTFVSETTETEVASPGNDLSVKKEGGDL